jgi:hypothetical protein
LADIRLKQEAYRGTFHQYMGGIPAACNNKWTPDRTPNSRPVDPVLSDNCTKAWRQLGITFPGNLYFVYDTVAGVPGATPPTRYSGANAANDFWYGAAAFQDLNDDGNCGGFIVVSGDIKMNDVDPEGSCNY